VNIYDDQKKSNSFKALSYLMYQIKYAFEFTSSYEYFSNCN